MNDSIKVIVSKNKYIPIDLEVFNAIVKYVKFSNPDLIDNIRNTKKVSYSKLVSIAKKDCFPYILFFGEISGIRKQIKNYEKSISLKYPMNKEIGLITRGSACFEDIKPLAYDLASRQKFLKEKILTSASENNYLNSLQKFTKTGHSKSSQQVADFIRDYFEINLTEFRGKNINSSKVKSLEYLIRKVETKNIFISKSAGTYMPKSNLGEISCFCVRDKYFPIIFLNLKDSQKSVRIIEPTGRIIFNVLTMLVGIGMKKFVLPFKIQEGDNDTKLLYEVACEIIIPRKDLNGVKINSYEELCELSNYFKVTPSLMLFRIKQMTKIQDDLLKLLWEKIEAGRKAADNPNYTPHLNPVSGYGRYIGDFLSRAYVQAYNLQRIDRATFSQTIFRKSKVKQEYFDKFLRRFS